MAMQTSHGGGNMPMSDINVTPLVDVMLVLLIIFMVTAPHLEKGVKVELPPVAVANDLKSTADEMVLTVTKDQKIFIKDAGETKDITLVPNLGATIREALTKHPRKEIYLRADKNVPYGIVVKVMAAAKEAEVTGLGMVTEQEAIEKP